jgi:hypothetical protein
MIVGIYVVYISQLYNFAYRAFQNAKIICVATITSLVKIIFSFLCLLFDHRCQMRIFRCLLDQNSPACNQTYLSPNSYRFVSFPVCRKEIKEMNASLILFINDEGLNVRMRTKRRKEEMEYR